MKIVVISYDELNIRPTEEQVLYDLFSVFKESSEEQLEEMGETLRNQIDSIINGNDSAAISFMNTSSISFRNQIESFIKNESPDLLISYNLAGFEMGTLTDSVLYNLLDCRQFHFIKKENLPNEKYLDKLLSINLFIFKF